ncbi:calmodulin-like protein 3 [Benincasa hispida]|uniref:calmodulin-like protein 3 n=1 Tax=Benincasa hispida TaxID=102211 RepID=UPI001901BCAE|nr:calmodulin-like protein 3 [Benincasa hispida]
MSTNPLHYHEAGTGNYMSEKEANSLIQKYDKNGDSILTKEELTALIIDQAASHHQLKPKKEEVVCKPQKVEAKVIPDEKGPFKMRLTRDEMREIFLEHDIDGDGHLTRSELSKALTTCGSLISLHKANYALNLADADGDGLINVDELEKVLDYVEKLNKLKK